MAQLKDVLNKIHAVKKTKQITKAMNMVAASRLRGAQTKMEAFRPYANKFGEVLGSLAAKSGDEANPLLVPRDNVKKIHLLLCTSDRGLCGGFNANLIQKAEKFIQEKAGPKGVTFHLPPSARRDATGAVLHKQTIAEEHLGVVGGTFGFNVATTAGRKLVDRFLDGTYDEVHIIYAEFLGMAKQIPTLRQLLPIPPITAAGRSRG